MTGELPLRLLAEGRIADLSEDVRRRLLDRASAEDRTLEAMVADILRSVRERGDAALGEMAERFDGVRLASLEVPRARWDEALSALQPDVLRALERAASNIRRFHAALLPADVSLEVEPGVQVTRRWAPLDTVGVYAPGGRAAYPSSVLMGVVPARTAGVREIVVCSPPGPSGEPPIEVLAACALGGADRLFALGGAGAVAALAFGTESVPAADAVIGPGNRWVTEAKRQVAGRVLIDSPAGPSEVLVLADGSTDPAFAAHELLAQAEHDPDAACVLVTTSESVAGAVRSALARLLASAPRREIAGAALAANGALLVAGSVDEAVAFAGAYAPEHLSVMTDQAAAVAARVTTAGTTFVGPWASVAFGDYLTGANHVLPTAGRARSFSGLSVLQCLRSFTVQEITSAGAAAMAADVAILAEAEGLPAHAAAASAGGNGDAVSRSDYRSLTKYLPDRRAVALDLSDNTNQWGTHPAALACVHAVGTDDLARYPELYADAFREAVGRRYGVDPECVTTGAGSDDVLDSAFRAASGPGGSVTYASPTFSMIEPLARMNGLEARAVPWTEALEEPARLLAGDPSLVYLCRPNNPTGALAPAEWVERLLDRVGPGGPLVILDEAYADFAGESFISRAPGIGRFLVARTLSKAYGLAGLRVGFGVGSPEVALEVEKSRGPFKVARIAASVAAAALDDSEGWTERTVAECVANRTRLAAALQERGLPPLPSRANFLFFQSLTGSARADALALRERGVAVRPFPGDMPDGTDGLRVTVGPWPLLERFLAALDDFRRTLERA